MSSPRAIALAVATVFLGVASAAACRFNVRDVGFVDLGSEPYRYLCFIDSATPAAQAEAIGQISAAAFLDANIEAEVVNLAKLEDQQALEHYRLAGSPEAPAAVLVAPDGSRAMAMPLVDNGALLQESLWTNMERVYESDVRDSLIGKVIESYAVIIIVEGTDADENTRVRGAADGTVTKISAVLDKLEKAIDQPPVVHVIPADQAESEQVFLWSLGIDAADRQQASVAVLYGRGRQLGNVIEGEAITESELFRITATVGLNCECGLDRAWMQGAMIPMKWPDERQKLVASLLGFDAEDPKIKMEMSQILSKGADSSGGRDRQRPQRGTGIDDLLGAYEEFALGEAASVRTDEDGLKSAELETAATSGVAAIALVTLAVAVLLGGTIIALRGRTRHG